MQQAKIINIKDEGHDVKSFTIKSDEEITFLPGQYAMLSYPDDSETKRAFSIVNHARDNTELNFLIKKNGAFTTRLFNTDLNQELIVHGPYGRFCLPKQEEPVIMIAGGVGITPFYSMLLSVKKGEYSKKAYLFYSSKTKEEMMLFDELKNLQDDKIKTYFFFTRSQNPEGYNGRINASIIKEKVVEFQLCKFFICGPKTMIGEMRKNLNEIGIDDERIRSEEFD